MMVQLFLEMGSQREVEEGGEGRYALIAIRVFILESLDVEEGRDVERGSDDDVERVEC